MPGPSPAGDRAGQRHEDVVAAAGRGRRADHVAQRPEPDVVLVATRASAPSAAWPSSWTTRASEQEPEPAGRLRQPPWPPRPSWPALSSSNDDEQDQEDVDPDCVPDHRPRLIGDHVRGSLIIGHPRRVANVGARGRDLRDYTVAAPCKHRSQREPCNAAANDRGALCAGPAASGRWPRVVLDWPSQRSGPDTARRPILRQTLDMPRPIRPADRTIRPCRVDLGPRSYEVRVVSGRPDGFGRVRRAALDATWAGRTAAGPCWSPTRTSRPCAGRLRRGARRRSGSRTTLAVLPPGEATKSARPRRRPVRRPGPASAPTATRASWRWAAASSATSPGSSRRRTPAACPC